jgi:hypothetical protein
LRGRPFPDLPQGEMYLGASGAVVPPPGTMQVQPSPGLDPQLEKRFDEMDRRMDQLLKMMEELRDGRTPPHHAEK